MSTNGPEPLSYSQMMQFMQQGNVESVQKQIQKYIEPHKDNKIVVIPYRPSNDSKQILSIVVRCKNIRNLTKTVVKSLVKAYQLIEEFQLGEQTKSVAVDRNGQVMTREWMPRVRKNSTSLIEKCSIEEVKKELSEVEFKLELFGPLSPYFDAQNFKHYAKKRNQLQAVLKVFNPTSKVFDHPQAAEPAFKATQQQTENIWKQTQSFPVDRPKSSRKFLHRFRPKKFNLILAKLFKSRWYPKTRPLSRKTITKIQSKSEYETITRTFVEQGEVLSLPSRKMKVLGSGAAKVAEALRLHGGASQKVAEKVLKTESELHGEPLQTYWMLKEVSDLSLFDSFDYQTGKCMLEIYQNMLEDKIQPIPQEYPDVEHHIRTLENSLYDIFPKKDKQLLSKPLRKHIRDVIFNKYQSRTLQHPKTLVAERKLIKKRVRELNKLTLYAQKLNETRCKNYRLNDPLAKTLSDEIRRRVNRQRIVESYPKKGGEQLYKQDKKMVKALHAHLGDHVGKKYITKTRVCTYTPPNGNNEETIIAEYCNEGQLLDYVLKMEEKEFVPCALQLALGYCALSAKDHEGKAFIHRDGALRNILVQRRINSTGEEEFLYKINDFGLSEVITEVYGISDSEKGPIIWMAPEALMEGHYSEKTDVYAYGITLLELFSRDTALDTVLETKSIKDVAISVAQGKAMEIWQDQVDLIGNSYPEIAELITMCLKSKANERPNFVAIAQILRDSFKEKIPKSLISDVEAVLK